MQGQVCRLIKKEEPQIFLPDQLLTVSVNDVNVAQESKQANGSIDCIASSAPKIGASSMVGKKATRSSQPYLT